jgi:hypothetical protein
MSKPKTLTELLAERGIGDLPKEDQLYQTKFVLHLKAPSKRPTPSKSESSETSAQQRTQPGRLIDRSSNEPQDRQTWIYWLGALLSAFRAPQVILLARVREVLWSARKDGVDYRDLYQVAQEIQPSRYPKAPDLDLVDPER